MILFSETDVILHLDRLEEAEREWHRLLPRGTVQNEMTTDMKEDVAVEEMITGQYRNVTGLKCDPFKFRVLCDSI